MTKKAVPIPLIVLDVQDAIDQPVWADKNNPDYVKAIQKLLVHWREKGWPVLHIKHHEPTPTSTYHTHGPWSGIKSDVAPIKSEPVIIKEKNCAFVNTELDATLKSLTADRFVLTGVVLHNSMDATIRAGNALGYHIYLPTDATTAVSVKAADGKSWDAQTVFDLTAAILGSEYAELTTTDQLMNDFFS